MKEIEIPEGYDARIDGNKVIIFQKESDDERIIKKLQEYVKNRNWTLTGPTQDEVLAYLERQKESLHISESCKEKADSFTDEYERIRKELWEYFHDLQLSSDSDFSPSLTIDDILAYLERQKEQKPTKRPKFKIGDVVKFKGFRDEPADDTPLKIVGYDNELYLFDNGTTDLFSEQDLYELVEQKPLFTEETELNSIAFLEQLGYTCIPSGDEDRYMEGYMNGMNDALKKAEWSEEDSKVIETLIRELRTNAQFELAVNKIGLNYVQTLTTLDKCPQHWKPSKDQIKALYYAKWHFAVRGDLISVTLDSLLEDLGKL